MLVKRNVLIALFSPKRHWFLRIPQARRSDAPAKSQGVVYEGRDGSLAIEYRGRALRWQEIPLTPWARVEGLRITYPPESLSLGFESNKQEAR